MAQSNQFLHSLAIKIHFSDGNLYWDTWNKYWNCPKVKKNTDLGLHNFVSPISPNTQIFSVDNILNIMQKCSEKEIFGHGFWRLRKYQLWFWNVVAIVETDNAVRKYHTFLVLWLWMKMDIYCESL